MKTKPLTYLLALTFLFLFSGSSVVFGDDLQDGLGAYDRKDYKAAHKLLLPLAEQGIVYAQSILGLMYLKGEGVPQDFKEAVKWIRSAAEWGFAYAQFDLGAIYERGKGVPQDYKEAVKWYRLSAEQGIVYAQVNLGSMYANGHGVPKDSVLAHMWWNLAGSNGNERASKNRKLVEKEMSPQQITQAQEMARNWKPKKLKNIWKQFKDKVGTN